MINIRIPIPDATTDPTSLLNHTPTASTFTGLPNSTINNNTSAQRLDDQMPSSNQTNANTSNSHNASRDSHATTSNDDSVDSSAGKKRRRRKPNKTCRLSNNGIDDDDDDVVVVSNNNKNSEPMTSTELPVDVRLVDTAATNELNKSAEIEKKSNSVECPSTSSGCDNRIIEPPHQSLENTTKRIVSAVENGLGSIKDDESVTDNRADGFFSPVTTRTRRSTSRITSPNELSQDNNSSSSNSSAIQRRPGKRKSEPDADCETIDKIAAMIASPDFNPKNGRSTPVVQTSDKIQMLGNGKINETSVTNPVTKVHPVDQKDRRFEDVEIKLEEMFAGIEDDVDQTKVKCTKLEGLKEVRVAIESLGSLETIVPKTENKKKTKAKIQKKTLNSSSTSDDTTTDHKAKKPAKRLPKSKIKKGRGKGKKANNKPVKGNTAATDTKKTKIKEETLDTTSKFRGPFIHVTTDGSSNVINAPITEEIAENKSKVKKTFTNHNQNDRSKIRGLHVSTLSMKYDAATTDKSWMCVFCKVGPHKFGLGDLFGPYILSTIGEDFELSQVDPAEDVFKSRKTKANMIQKRTLPPVAVGVVATTGNVSFFFSFKFFFFLFCVEFNFPFFNIQKRKRKANEPIPSTSSNSSLNSSSSCISDTVVDIFHGMTKATDTSYEVWVHGDCAVWSSGVHLIGQRIVGLDAAVWSSTRHQCNKCQHYGAMLCCFKRGCGDVAHVACARKAKWNLCEENFKILCDKHCEDGVEKAETVMVKQT